MSVKDFCLLLILSLPVCAAEPWTLPLFTTDPREVLAAAQRYPTPDGLDAITLDYSVRVDLDDSGKMHKITRTVSRVLRLQGIEGSRQVSAPWIPWRENRPKLKARVVTADGKPHLLDEASIGENAMPGGTSGNSRLLSAELPAVDIDSVIEVETEQSDHEAADPDARWVDIPVASRYLVGHFSAVIEASSARALRVEPRGFHDPKKSISAGAGQAQQVTIEDSGISPGQSSILLPPDRPSVPTITVSTGANWQSVAQWYGGLLKASLPAAIQHTPAMPDQIGAIEAVFEDIQKKVKSTNAALGSSPYAPQTPTETLKKGSGDSKDKAVLLLSKLAEIGISAKAAVVRSAPDSDLLPGLPGVEPFTRMLVYVPGQHPLWIDPGIEFTPVSRLPLIDQDRWALIVDASTTDLVRTPQSTASDNGETATTDIRLEDGGDAKVVVSIEARGAFEDLARPVYASAASDQSEMDQRRNELVQMSQVKRITKLDPGEPRKLLTPYRLDFAGEGYMASTISDAAASVDLPGPAAVGFQQLTPFVQAIARGYTPAQIVGTRKVDYYAPPPFGAETRFHVTAPPDYRLNVPPPISPLNLGPLTLSSNITAEADGSVWVRYELLNPKWRYTPQEMLAMLQDFQKLAGKTFLRIGFRNLSEEKLAGGELKEGISLLRKNAASATDNENATLRLATAYVQVGARDEAIKLCRKALAKNPNNAAAYARLGWIYTHNEFGRAFRPGMSMAEAEQAYLKAIELAPGEKSYSIELALLYTYNAAGIHYGRSARLDEAIQRFREAGTANLARYNVLNDYAATLLVSRRYEEVKQLFLLPEAGSANPAIKIAAIAATGGATDIKEEADFIASGAEKQKALFLEAAKFLLGGREYQPAWTLFQMAGSTTRGPSEMALEKIHAARNFDEAAASAQPAIAAFQRFVATILNPVHPGAWKKQLVPESPDFPLARYRAELLYFANGPAGVDADPSSWPFISDILTTTFSFSAEGSDPVGFRIRASDSAGKGQRTFAYVIRRDNEYLIAGLSGSAAFSSEAFERAQRGDMAGARQWLNWAKDELPPTKAADPMAELAVQRVWPPQSAATPDVIKAAAAMVAARGKHYQPAIAELQQMRERTTDADLQTAVDQGLAQALLVNQQYGEAIPVLQRLRARWASSELVISGLIQALIYTNRFDEASALIETSERTEGNPLRSMRFRELLLAQEGKFKDAAALQEKICANAKANAFDWNDLAWVDLFAHSDKTSMGNAASKAEQLMQGRNASVLQTVAVVQASIGALQQARANAYHLMDGLSDPDDLLTIFGRIAEQVDLRDVAADYYGRVKKPESNSTLSNYAFAQMRLKELSASKASS